MICRLCLIALNSEEIVPLFSEFGSNDEPQLVKTILKYLHLDITWSDEISTAICRECSKHLNEFDKYCEYVREQQIILSQKVLVGHHNAEKNVDAALSVEPMEVQVKCESEEDVAKLELYLKCEPEETVLAEMALSNASSSHSNSSSYSKPSSSSFFHQIDTNGCAEILEQHCIDDSSTSCECISDTRVNSLPDADTIKLLQPIKEIYKSYSMGDSLKNKERVQIAKAVINECLKDTPAKLIHREDFEKLAENIKEVFPSEFVSMYFVPSIRNQQASGKLYNAFHNKRNALKASGEINRRMKTYEDIDITPNPSQIKLLRPLQQIHKKYQLGKTLQNKDRVFIAKAVIDACLDGHPDKILKRECFAKLSHNIIQVFPTETAEPYFVPAMRAFPARGKLWSAYNNKRTALKLDGLIKRRHRLNSNDGKTSPSLSSMPSDASTDMMQIADISEAQVFEYIQYLEQNTSDWPNILSKWAQTHKFRNKKLKTSLSTHDYITKFPALQGDKGIELVSTDVKILYPAVGSVENWLHLYEKLLNRARSIRDNMLAQLIAEIDASSDKRFKAGLTLIFIPYIFPHTGKRGESSSKRATKSDIQQRFIKEYKSISELNAEEQIVDLQIKFVKENGAITYAEFNIAGYKFKCVDIIEALNLGFMYMNALNVAYPKLCIHVWQFVQLAIYKIDLSYTKVSSLETIVNDMFSEV